MSDKVFNFIRFLAEVAITGIGAAYYELANKINLPYGDTVVAVCAFIAFLLGIVTQWQRYRYQKSKDEIEE